ncbi:MAG: hypothetical protein RIS76_3008 [Verrucomicrobiota bacterium]
MKVTTNPQTSPGRWRRRGTTGRSVGGTDGGVLIRGSQGLGRLLLFDGAPDLLQRLNAKMFPQFGELLRIDVADHVDEDSLFIP